MRAAIYLRISQDKNETREGVQRQRKDCEDLCAREGWTVEQVFEDNDQSAYRGKPRQQYPNLLNAISRREIDLVVFWRLDRLWRDDGEKTDFMRLASAADMKFIADTTSGLQRLDDADDKFIINLRTAFAARESDLISLRVRTQQRHAREQGKSTGGPSYGYRPVGDGKLQVVPAEAQIIREIVRRLLAGETTTEIAVDLNTRDVTTLHGSAWNRTAVKRVATSTRAAGIIDYDGSRYKGAWKPIISEEQHDRVLALLGRQPHQRGHSTRRVRKYVLTGVGVCGRCGTRLIPGVGGSKAKPFRQYKCPSRGDGGCGGVSINAANTEEVLVDAIADYLDSKAFAAALRRAEKRELAADSAFTAINDDLQRFRARLSEVEDTFADGEIDRATFVKLRERVAARIRDCETRMDRITAVGPAGRLLGQAKETKRLWPTLTILEQRTIVDALVERITVQPAEQPFNRFNPARIEIVWRFD